uniref:Uncharacterized protein n=1 Tax=viral metagenome TaxID=1070528 RepID=A0A6M3KY10_9ZZZZ
MEKGVFVKAIEEEMDACIKAKEREFLRQLWNDGYRLEGKGEGLCQEK